MDTFWKDLRHGLRVLARSRGFTAVAVLSLAIAIGANAAIFGVANALLFRPLPYPHADRLAIIWQRSPGLDVAQDWLSLGQYLDIKAENHVFEDVAAAIGTSFNLTGQGAPERVDGARVSSSLFALLGAGASLGRVFLPDDDQPGRPPIAILSDGFWRRRFGSDPGVIGRSILLNGTPVTIVGVATPGFRFDREVLPAVNGIRDVDVLLPLPLAASARAKRDGEDFNLYARMRPGVSLDQARADMAVIARRMQREYPQNYPANGGLTLDVVPLLHQVVGDVRPALHVLLGAVGLVLLIACGNVANLLLSRAAVREKEIAIRAAIGASRARIVRQMLSEGALLAVAGGVLGLVLALVAVGALRIAAPAEIPRLEDVRLDGRVLAFTLVVSTLSGMLVGLAPALRASRADPNAVLKEGGRSEVGTSGFGLGHGRLRAALIVAEVALSLVLLVGAGLLVRSYQRITDASPGFDPRGVLSLRTTLPFAKYKTPELVSAFYRQLEQRVRALPGVEHVGANYALPLSSVALAWEPIGVEGYVPKSESEALIISSSGYVSADYFRALGVPLVRGRFFGEHDTRESPPVAIVNEQLAARFWPGQDPIGKRLRKGDDGPWRTVVGVVSDTKEYAAAGEPAITTYFPVEQFNIPSRFLVVRAAGDPAALTAAVTREIHAIDPDLPLYDVSPMETRLRDSLARRRFSTALLATFAVVALVLAAIGIYGVIAYWVDQRTREIGIRVALGAARHDIIALVLRQALLTVSIGIALGLVAAAALTRVMASQLFGVSTIDAVTFGAIPALLAAIALVASYLPTRRALRVEPMEAGR
jgi:predicted permease